MPVHRDKQIKLPGKKANSPFNSTSQPPTYVVGFALKETYDDLVTAQQMICNKRSPQASINSITPTNSLKLLDSTHTVKLEQIPDPPDSKDNVVEENKVIEENNPATFEPINSESNIEDADQNKVIRFLETDEATDSSNDEKAYNFGKANSIANVDNVEKSGQPEVIFNAINYGQRCKSSKFLKRKPKIHKSVAPKCNKFKCKTPKNCINNSLDKYYVKVKQNSMNSEHMRDGFSNISTVVPRTRVLKNCLAKENLLDETEFTTSTSNYPCNQFNENDDGSQSSYPSTAKNDSFISNSSGKTLTLVSSTTSSKNEDPYGVDSIKSAIEMSQNNTPTYKSDVINVAVAVAYKNSKNIISVEKITNNEKFMHLASLTSQFEPLTTDMGKLTSETPSDFEVMNRPKGVNLRKTSTHSKEMSNATLVNKRSHFDLSSEDSFDMARTSSDFNENAISIATLKKDIENESNHQRKEFDDDVKTKNKKSILETVINLGYYPDVTPSTSSGVTVTDVGMKDFLITDKNRNYHVCSKNMGDHCKENKINSNIFIKQFNERDISTKKPVNLPNHDEIKLMLNDDMQQMKHTEESSNLYKFPEMWDKLILVLDVAFKRLETTVTEKIVKELKNSIASLNLHAQPIPEVDLDLEKEDIVVIEPPKHEVISKEDFKETDRSQQCSLVRSEVIDQIMQTLCTQGPQIIESGRSVSSLQRLKTKLIKNYVDVQKLPIPTGPEVLEDKGDTVTISTVRTEVFDRARRMRMPFFWPIRFIRENLFVIASVPAFFVVFVFVYGILALLIKPW